MGIDPSCLVPAWPRVQCTTSQSSVSGVITTRTQPNTEHQHHTKHPSHNPTRHLVTIGFSSGRKEVERVLVLDLVTRDCVWGRTDHCYTKQIQTTPLIKSHWSDPGPESGPLWTSVNRRITLQGSDSQLLFLRSGESHQLLRQLR